MTIQRNSANAVIVIIVCISARRYGIKELIFNIIILNRNTQSLSAPLRATRCIRCYFNAPKMISIFIRIHVIMMIYIDSCLRSGFLSSLVVSFRIVCRAVAPHRDTKSCCTRYACQAHQHRNRQSQRYHFLHKFVPPLILVAYIVNPPFSWYTLFDPCRHHRFQRWSFPACLQGSFFVPTFFISHWNRPPFFFILHDIPPSSPSLVAKSPFFDANFI